MPIEGISPEVREFVFEHIDAVEHLDVLLLLHESRSKEWTAESINRELRTNQESINRRLAALESSGLLNRSDQNPPSYQYSPKTPELDNIVQQLAETCRVRKHRILELIFSPIKRARSISRAFEFKKRGDVDE